MSGKSAGLAEVRAFIEATAQKKVRSFFEASITAAVKSSLAKAMSQVEADFASTPRALKLYKPEDVIALKAQEEPVSESMQKISDHDNMEDFKSDNHDVMAILDIDKAFLSVLNRLITLTVETCSGAASSILDISSGFLTDQAHKSIREFYELYFDASKAQDSIAANQSVDHLFDSLTQAHAEGRDLVHTASFAEEDETVVAKRLLLSAFQKNLESLISLDENLKARLYPVLSSMQFEDIVKGRIMNVRTLWEHLIVCAHKNERRPEYLLTPLKALAKSHLERKVIYEMILNENPPEGVDDQSTLMDILF